MLTESRKKALLDPYRTVGRFLSGRLSLSASAPPALTAPTGCSFKVYSEALAVKVASPCFPHPVAAAFSYNEHTYVRTRGQVVKMKYHHVVGQWAVKGGEQPCQMLLFDGLLLLHEGSALILVDERTGEVAEQDYGFPIAGIAHPVTYVNKLLLYSPEHLLLVNPISQKVLYSFQKFLGPAQESEQLVTVVEASPLVDVVGVGFDSGTISFLHLRKDQAVFSVKQKLPVTALAFNREQSWLCSGDPQGNVILWDLQAKRILFKFEQCLNGPIDSLLFLPGVPVVTCGSSEANCIRQLRVNLEDNKILSLYRERLGSKEALEGAVIGGDNELVLSTQSETMFVSFHSQCNSYLLPRVLASRLPYHLVARHFNVDLYAGNSLLKTFPLHEHPTAAAISLSNKFYLVASKRKLVKLGGSSPVEWPVPNVRQILPFNEHSVFAATPDRIVVCDFNTPTIVATIDVQAHALTTNIANTLLGFWNVSEQQVEVWEMQKVRQGRVFRVEGEGEVLHLSFSAENRFLLSSHSGGRLNIWSVVDNELYKCFEAGCELLWHGFTPDNQFFLSIARGAREANVWNNYLGRITSTRNAEPLAFQPEIRVLQNDYRRELDGGPQQQLEARHKI